MKILIVGATGMVGGEVLNQCLSHPKISSVVVFLRRKLSDEFTTHPKLESVLIEDFSKWSDDVLKKHADAAAMIWAMGTYKGSVTADYEYPLVFQKAFINMLQANAPKSPFRYIQLGGKFIRPDQDASLWFLPEPRKLKGLLETETLELAQQNSMIWEAFNVRPGAIYNKTWVGSSLMGADITQNWFIRLDQVGVYMVHLAVGGDESEKVVLNGRMVSKARELQA